MPKRSLEATIRDKLAHDLSVIESGLSLIKDEYHVKNPNGADGFIDLFARDRNGNLVVIEVKRSDSSSREAIAELAKYAALLRAAKNLRSSELRLLVVSSTWRELLVPFSELFHNTTYQLEGHKFEIDDQYNPVRLQKIEPLPDVKGRLLCRRHMIRYYTNEQEMLEAEQILQSESERVGIKDFVVVRFVLCFDDPYYGATCGLYYSHQLKDRSFYEDCLYRVADSDRLEEIEAWVEELDEEDAVDELADALAGMVQVPCATLEIGYPEMFSQRLDTGLWQVAIISRYGVFCEDERLTDEHLISDLCGTTGASFVHYFAAFQLENREKIREVIIALNNPLFHNDLWRHTIKDILEYAQRKSATSIVLHTFNTDDLLETVWMSKMEARSSKPGSSRETSCSWSCRGRSPTLSGTNHPTCARSSYRTLSWQSTGRGTAPSTIGRTCTSRSSSGAWLIWSRRVRWALSARIAG